MATAGGGTPAAGVTPPGLDGTELREATMGEENVEVGTSGRGYGTPTNGLTVHHLRHHHHERMYPNGDWPRLYNE